MTERIAGPLATKTPDRNAQREAARRQAASLSKKGSNRQRTQRLIIGVASILVLVLLGWGGWIIFQASQSTLLSDFEGTSPATANDRGGVPIGSAGAGSPNDGAVELQVYIDFSCPACASFEEVNGADIKEMVDDGTITAIYHPVNYLGPHSEVAGNAFLTVAEGSPEHALTYAEQLFTLDQGASPEQFAALATELGVPEDVAGEIAGSTYNEWLSVASDQARRDGARGTPTIMVNGDTLNPDAGGPNWSQPGELTDYLRNEAG